MATIHHFTICGILLAIFHYGLNCKNVLFMFFIASKKTKKKKKKVMSCMNYINCVHLHCASESGQNNALSVQFAFGFEHLTHQNFSACALFCHNSLAIVNTLLIMLIIKWMGGT